MGNDIEFSNDIIQAAQTIKRGGLILYPTDTIWGIGCDATNSDAVKRVFELKRRADSKALITLVATEAMLERHVAHVPDIAWQLIDAAVHPLTIVYDHGIGVAPELLAPDGSIGIRLTRERFSSTLCRHIGRPLVSTSANISGAPAPLCFGEINPEIIDGVDYVANYGRNNTETVAPSNIIKLTDSGVVTIIR